MSAPGRAYFPENLGRMFAAVGADGWGDARADPPSAALLREGPVLRLRHIGDERNEFPGSDSLPASYVPSGQSSLANRQCVFFRRPSLLGGGNAKFDRTLLGSIIPAALQSRQALRHPPLEVLQATRPRSPKGHHATCPARVGAPRRSGKLPQPVHCGLVTLPAETRGSCAQTAQVLVQSYQKLSVIASLHLPMKS